MTIYMIQAGKDGPVKIGKSADPAKRMKGMQTHHYEELRLIREIDGHPSLEGWFRRKFEAAKIRGEWFRFCPDMLTVEPPKPNDWNYRMALGMAPGYWTAEEKKYHPSPRIRRWA